MILRPALRVPAALAVTAMFLLVTACMTEWNRVPPLTFAYHHHNGSGLMDQTVEIINSGRSAEVPTLEIVPVDSSGAVLAGIHVTTLYGSDVGRLLAPARMTSSTFSPSPAATRPRWRTCG
ncbi:hypothetical protein [Paractinoplanes durhamensis]|uniref:hypothetical protein n=1 Tax=Paractinoplanes durhamensis TaxID=113563 RepID=UPI00363196A7